jgi:hypothetical protein
MRVHGQYLVVCGLPAPQIVVVHARQVVVDERHGVDHFRSNGARQALLEGAAKHLTGLGFRV